MSQTDLDTLISVIKNHRRILILTHEKPDGDAVGASFGLLRILRNADFKADVLMSDPVPAKYRPYSEECLTSAGPGFLADYDLAIALDCARYERISACGLDLRSLPLINLDHHRDNEVKATYNFVDPAAAATSQLVFELGAKAFHVDALAATRLFLGLVTDTGSFRFSNTNARCLRCAAAMLEAGADHEAVINSAFFSKPRAQQQFEAALVQQCLVSAADGKYVYAVIPDELLTKYGFDMKDSETLIDLLREIEGSVIAALIYHRSGGVKVSLRSKNEKYPVGPIAREFGGGGHQMAAGIGFADKSFGQVEAILLEKITGLLSKA